jgi:hypothetical protein
MSTFSRLFFASLVAAASAAPASAQIDPGLNVIVQAEVEQGQVFVPEDQDACTYMEYWYLYEGYAYPSLENRASITVTPVQDTYDGSLERFVEANKRAHPRGTLVEVASVEHREGCK